MSAEVLNIAKNCRHYAMCKIDYLETGVCASGLEKGFVSYFPQGRMDLYAALAEGRVNVTERCADIAETCDLCGKCNYQCYYVTELKPVAVMKALKEYVETYIAAGGIPETAPEDDILREMRAVTGEDWSTSDRAVAVGYSHDPAPVTIPKLPSYVVMPGSKEEVSEIMKIITRYGLRWAVRGNGSSVIGLVMCDDVVIDLSRMKEINFDENNWKVMTGPGVAAFELQKEAIKRGYRVNVAEPAAMVCANIMCSGIFSTFSAAYGTLADNIVNAEFVSHTGEFISLNSKKAPNLFAFERSECSNPGICVSVEMKLHPVTNDETGIMVPFQTFEKAVGFAKELSVRRIGLAIGILGGEYISTFIAPTKALAASVKNVFTGNMRINWLVQVIGDRYAISAIKEMGVQFFDQQLFRTVMLGLPSLAEAEWTSILSDLEQDKPFDYLGKDIFAELAETALAPSAEQLADATDPEVRPFFRKLFSDPRMTDLVWLNTFRIVSSRMGREKHVVAWIIYLPVDTGLISEINDAFSAIGEKHGIKHAFGFITPLHQGKRCVFEYDYFLDHTDPVEKQKMLAAMGETAGMIESYSGKYVRWIRYVLYQGIARSESLLYGS